MYWRTQNIKQWALDQNLTLKKVRFRLIYQSKNEFERNPSKDESNANYFEINGPVDIDKLIEDSEEKICFDENTHTFGEMNFEYYNE